MATVGRKKRKRKPGSRTGVATKSHTRSPRGSDKGKKRVSVDAYQRGKPKGRSSGSTKRRKKKSRKKR